MNADAPLICLQQVCKRYGSGANALLALDHVSLVIGQGEFVAIMGPSGSGKSTAMNILGCLDTPSAGHYLFRGVDISSTTR
ncbi:MAG: ATP-binding cassette domain-containing protein, partial [Sphingomonadaceae bacterium]